MNKIPSNTASYILFIILLSIDATTLIASLEVALFVRSNYLLQYLPNFNYNNLDKYYWLIMIVLFMLILEKIYFIRNDFWEDMKKIFKALFFSFLTIFTMLTLTKMSEEFSRIFIVVFFLVASFLLPFSKRLIKKILFKYDFFKLKINIVAKDKQKIILSKEIKNNWYFGYKEDSKDYDLALIASRSFDKAELEQLIQSYSKKTKDIYVIPYMDHLDLSHASIAEYSNIRLSAIHIENKLLNYKNIFIKYIFEKIIVILIFPFALFLHIFISLLIKLDSMGEVIFKQKRLGKDSKVFSCYKYRSMYKNSDILLKEYLKNHPEEVDYYALYHKYKNDPRITRVGNFLRKTSLDEFPQFYNILQGKMSLIGPRPYMLNEKDKIGKSHEEIILKVKPGITGLWQVSGRNNLTFNERVELDKWYIQNWSLWADFVILIKTIKVVLFKVGVK
ncbi:sugar transferase [Sulfurimonas aquatica]|uniref:Sugar transferase n=2 Tax=Sulfurimonas aquatica TaxID=2672570 RepID=A0A975AYG8_9BACT|nr:sugar transferase [Sulfurimonas aquatica]